MLYSISIVVLNNLELTKKCLQLLEANSSSDYELIISDNGSKDGTAEFLSEYRNRHSNCRIITYPYNTGFGSPHNQALLQARGEYFVVLNNDIFIHESGWLEKMRDCFSANPRLGLVGFAGGFSALNDSGGSEKNPTRVEYIEASSLMVSREMAVKFGLFSDIYELAYSEDLDLSMRYRQMGFDIQLVSCRHEHVSNATSAILDKMLLSRVAVRNHKTFLKRWSWYLKKRSFTGRVLIRAVTESLDNLLAVTNVLQRLKEEQALVHFDLITNRPDLFNGHPAVHTCFSTDEALDREGYDRVIDFDFGALPSDLPAVLALAEQAVVSVTQLAPFLNSESFQQNSANPLLVSGRKYAALTVPREDEHFTKINALLGEAGYEPLIIEVLDDGVGFCINGSGPVYLRDLAAAVSASSLFIGPAGVPLKIAQALGVPSIALFQRGDDPLVLGVDAKSSRWIFVERDLPLQLKDVLAEEGYKAQAESAWLQRSILRRIVDYNDMWDRYRVVKEREQLLDKRVEQLEQEYAELEQRSQREYAELDKRSRVEHNNLITQYENSWSWRMTSPIRRIINIFRS